MKCADCPAEIIPSNNGMRLRCKSCYKRAVLFRARTRIREFVRRYKQFVGCSVCGERRWYMLDAHHVQGKDKAMPNCNTMTAAKRELRKCVILCANHHREAHHMERPA